METRKYLFETKWKQFLTEQTVKFPFELEVTSVNTELYNFLKANPAGYWHKTGKGDATDKLKGIVAIVLRNWATGATVNARFKIPGQENIETNIVFPGTGQYTYANNKLSLTNNTNTGPLPGRKTGKERI